MIGSLFSCKNVQEQVNIFNKTIINIFSNFIPNKRVKDPPWMTEKLKSKIKWKDKAYRDYLKTGKTEADYVHHAISEVSQLISESKDKYYNKLAMKLNNPKTSSKTYWCILKGAAKLYFMHYSCVVIVLFNAALCRSAFFYEFF